jgi:hypothetical protein
VRSCHSRGVAENELVGVGAPSATVKIGWYYDPVAATERNPFRLVLLLLLGCLQAHQAIQAFGAMTFPS